MVDVPPGHPDVLIPQVYTRNNGVGSDDPFLFDSAIVVGERCLISGGLAVG